MDSESRFRGSNLPQSTCTFIVNPREENKLKKGFSKTLLDINTSGKM